MATISVKVSDKALALNAQIEELHRQLREDAAREPDKVRNAIRARIADLASQARAGNDEARALFELALFGRSS